MFADWVILLNGIRTAISDTGHDYTLEPKTKETERRKHIVLFCSLQFNLFSHFFHAEIAETSHFRYKTEDERYNESTHPCYVKKNEIKYCVSFFSAGK